MTNNTHKIHLNEQVQIPLVGFGTFQIADDDAADAVTAAINVGYRHIDTAAVYNNEQGVGRGIKAAIAQGTVSRDALFVTTKLWPGYSGWGEVSKNSDQTQAAFQQSLDKLGLDYIDLYLIHSPHGGLERLPQWETLLALKESGKVRSIGVSNYGVKHLEEISNAGLPLPDVNQIELHPWSQKKVLLAWLVAHGIRPIAYSSLAPLSTWRTTPGQTSGKTAEMRSSGEAFLTLAQKYGVSEAQFLLRWAVQQGFPVLPKSLSPTRMRQNLDLFGFEIAQDDMAAISLMDRGNGIAWDMGDPSLID